MSEQLTNIGTELSPKLLESIDLFRDNLLQSDIVDSEGTHHEFKSGMHGQKIDFDLIMNGTPLYKQWVDVTANYANEVYLNNTPEIVIGVANGTNRLAQSVFDKMRMSPIGLVTAEDKDKNIYLPPIAETVITTLRDKPLLILEDVSTTGSSAAQVALKALELGVRRVEVLATWKRRETLEKLDEHDISYRAIIDEALSTFTPEDCKRHGFCADNWKLIKRS